MMNIDEFETIEQDMALDTSIIFGVYWWDLWRYSLYKDFIRSGVQKKIKSRLPIRRIYQGITRLRYLFVRKPSILVLRHPRFKKEDGLYIDIYTKIVGGHLEDLGYYTIYLEKRTPQSRRLSPEAVYPLDLIAAVSFFLAKIFPVSLMNLLSVNCIDKALYLFGVSNIKSVKKIILKSVIAFKIRVYFYRLLIKINKPKALFLVVSCGNEDIIYAAHKEGVVSIELQHGSPTRGKLNYDYSNNIDKSYFPDLFLSFGSFFTEQMSLPSPCKQIINFGYPFLQDKYQKLNRIRIKKYDLLVLSQPDCDAYIVLFLEKLIKKLPVDFLILVQLHPQYFSKINPYSALECANLTVADSIENSLYEAFSLSKSAITVYSTAIYEAKLFGLKTFILLDKHNYLMEFSSLNDVVVINSNNQIDDSIKILVNGVAGSCNKSLSLFEEYSIKKIEEVLKFVN